MSARTALTSRAGFTLLEVVVALTMLAVLLPAALGIIAMGLRSMKASSETTGAVLLARRQLDELAHAAAVPGAGHGATGAYRWTSEVIPEPRLVRLRVRVLWEQRGREQSLELATLRAAAPTGRAAAPTP